VRFSKAYQDFQIWVGLAIEIVRFILVLLGMAVGWMIIRATL
jgi:hypothetical protein